jgi:formylglycine-generating enzyme required for sulfatase activity
MNLKLLPLIATIGLFGAAAQTNTAGEQRRDPSGIEQVWVPAGSFQMGTSQQQAADILAQNPPSWVARELPSEQPQHTVQISKGYWIDKFEVTNAAYLKFVESGGYTTRSNWSVEGWQWLGGRSSPDSSFFGTAKNFPNQPKVNVTWFEAQAYATWRGGRLPSEAEWEYAARGSESLIYPWGNIFDASKTNLLGSTGLKDVGSYPSGLSWVGAHDMAGNAMEWVQDWLDVNAYTLETVIDPKGPSSGSIKVEKGGWWGSNPFVARAAYRHFEDSPDYGDKHIGFRIVTQQ